MNYNIENLNWITILKTSIELQYWNLKFHMFLLYGILKVLQYAFSIFIHFLFKKYCIYNAYHWYRKINIYHLHLKLYKFEHKIHVYSYKISLHTKYIFKWKKTVQNNNKFTEADINHFWRRHFFFHIDA